MTPKERRHDRLRHFPTMLSRWAGGRAKLWSYSISHSVLTIRIELDDVRGNLHITCSSLQHIHAPASWVNSNIQILLENDDDEFAPFIVQDVGNDVRVVCVDAAIAENVKPVL